MMNNNVKIENNKLSIIIPVYNVENYLDPCLNSVVSQSYKELEIILVDDGSTDGSSNICDIWEKKDDRIHVIHKSNAGAASARNAGLDVATGDFVMFVDADDLLETNACRCLLHALLKTNTECSICGYISRYEDGTEGIPVAVDDMLMLSGIEALKQRCINNNIALNIVNPWGKLFRAKVWHELRFSDGLYYEDLDIMPYCYQRCENIVVIPDIGYCYTIRTGSASHGTGTDNKRYMDSVLIRKKHITFYEEIGEYTLAVSTMKQLVELIIYSDCNGWIPISEYKESMNTFKRCLKILLKSRDVCIKDKIRYLIFRIFHVEGYRLLLRKIK